MSETNNGTALAALSLTSGIHIGSSIQELMYLLQVTNKADSLTSGIHIGSGIQELMY
jgi:hypothetical protein